MSFRKRLRIHSDYQGRRTYIMYHGTTQTAADKIQSNGFKRSTDGMLGAGVYVTRSFDKASRYPIDLPLGQKRVVLRLSVKVGKVKRIDRQDHPLQKSWHDEGYDTAWVPPKCGMVRSGLEENCIWDPKRIRVLEVLEEESSSEDSSEESTDEDSSEESTDEDSDSSNSESSDDSEDRCVVL